MNLNRINSNSKEKKTHLGVHGEVLYGVLDVLQPSGVLQTEGEVVLVVLGVGARGAHGGAAPRDAAAGDARGEPVVLGDRL